MTLQRLSMSGWSGHWSISLQNNQRLNACAQTLQDTRSLTSTNLHTSHSHQQPSRRFHSPVCMLVTSSANMSSGVTTKYLLTVRAWTPGKHQATLDCCITQRKQPASLTDRTSAPIQTWPSRVSARTADCRTDVFWESSRRSQHQPSLIASPKLKVPAHSDPVKRWNYRKAT